MSEPENCQVYLLKNPFSNEIFYVGIGKPGRCKAHTSLVRNSIATGKELNPANTRHLMIASILKSGSEPIIEIIYDFISKEQAKIHEVRLIEEIGRRDQGKGSLLNRTKGGEWINDCPRTELWLSRMSESAKIAQNKPEVKARKSAMLKGRKRTPEQIETIRKGQLAIRDVVSEKRMGANNPNAKPVMIDGVVYGSGADAARALGVLRHQLKRKFKVIILD